tara:strand:+ start:763 stop:1098 length:336 start_codon:yes stop_codon:yes gene_type:complete
MIKKILQTLTITLILTSCETKTGWTENEKIEFLKTCNKKHKDLKYYFNAEKMNNAMVKDLCNCILEESLLKYDTAPRNGKLTDSSHPEYNLRWSNKMFGDCVEKTYLDWNR